MFLAAILTSSILGIYIKSEHAKATAITWALLIGIIVLLAKGISFYLIIVPIVYLIGLGVFSLANYWEESVFLRLMALLFGAILIFASFGGLK